MARKLLQTAAARKRRAARRKRVAGKRGGAILTPAIMAAARAAKKAGRTSLSQAATQSVKSQIKKVGSGFFDAVRGFKSGAAPAGIRTAQKAPASYSAPAAAFWKAGHKGAGRKLHMTMGMK